MKDTTESALTEVEVTVGIPLWNNARTVARAIASVRAQTFQGWRLIVTDDCSYDGTLEAAREAAGDDVRIEIRRNDSRLGYGNFAVSLRAAETPFFAWLAGDDYWHPEFLERTVSALRAARGAVSALPGAAFVTGGGGEIPNLGFLRGDPAGRVRRYLAHPGGTRMYGLMRTDAARDAFPARPSHAYDWYLMVALLARGPQLSVPGQLLFREKTGWTDYARAGDRTGERGLFLRFPVLRVSLALVRDRRIPLRALPALVGLNLRKHEEFLAVNRPRAFLARAGLFGWLGTPIARDASKLAELAELHRSNGQGAEIAGRFADAARRIAPAGMAARPAGAAPVTAIVACRNAEATMGAWLDHAAGLGCRIVVVDHGSTDATRAIAEARLGGQVEEIVDMPYHGVFDLTAQLELKRAIAMRPGPDWIWHADADEFLELEPGETLECLTRNADRAGHLAFACDEALYLPRFEDEAHDPETFRKTMTDTFTIRERDEKQRLFRRTASLDTWFATGGHTLTRDPAALAPVRLRLAHYMALSLDDLRGQYLSRVFAPRDIFKLWHGNRAAARRFDVVAPCASAQGSTSLPVFAPRIVLPETVSRSTNLVVRDAQPADSRAIGRALNAAVPGLRYRVTTATDVDAGAVPVLSVVCHPGRLHASNLTRGDERALASDWVRRIANARMDALDRGTPYAEVRIEDIEAGAVDLCAVVRSLFTGRIARGTGGFLAAGAPPLTWPVYATPVRDITRRLAADLGYF